MSSEEREDPTAESASERYAAGRMSDQEEQAFEVRMLESRDLAAEVDAAHRMRVGLRELQARGELDELLDGTRSRAPLWALAAGMAVLLIGAGLALRHRDSHRLPGVIATSLADFPPGRSSPRHIETFTLAHTRGSDEPPTITLSPRSEVIVLRVLPSVPGSSRTYHVTLARVTDGAATPVAREIDAQAAADGFVQLDVDPSYLVAGNYQISLTQTARSEQFPVRIAFSP